MTERSRLDIEPPPPTGWWESWAVAAVAIVGVILLFGLAALALYLGWIADVLSQLGGQ